jgi:hypothetical protein
MQLISDKPSGLKETKTAIVEVKLWEAFLRYNRHNLYSTLSTYSIDNGEVHEANEDFTTISFRFMRRDWNNTLRDLLAKHNIPVIKETSVSSEQEVAFH